MDIGPSLLSSAIVVWTGHGEERWPDYSESRVADRFGHEFAAIAIPRIQRLADEFDASDANLVVADLAEMGDRAAGQFREGHPEVSGEAIDALAWCYMWKNK